MSRNQPAGSKHHRTASCCVSIACRHACMRVCERASRCGAHHADADGSLQEVACARRAERPSTLASSCCCAAPRSPAHSTAPSYLALLPRLAGPFSLSPTISSDGVQNTPSETSCPRRDVIKPMQKNPDPARMCACIWASMRLGLRVQHSGGRAHLGAHARGMQECLTLQH